jgi:hypothetical protein
MSLPVLLAVALLLAHNQTTTVSEAVVIPPAAVKELIVTPQPKCLQAKSAPAAAPKIVSTFPREGQVVRPGLLVFRTTFDRPMACSGFLTALTSSVDPCPQQAQAVAWNFDHKTVRTLCLTQPGRTYGVVVGGGCSLPFASLDGQLAQPLAVRFTTSNGPETTSVSEALAQDSGEPSLASTVGSPVDHGLDGTWVGGLTDWRGYRTLLLRVSTNADGALAATLSWEYQSGVFQADSVAADLPTTEFSRDGQQVEFKLPTSKSSYAGTLSADGSTMEGFWTEHGRATPTDFTCVLGRSMQGFVVAPIKELPTLPR